MNNLICEHCRKYVSWSSLLDDWYCGDCRTRDVIELEASEE